MKERSTKKSTSLASCSRRWLNPIFVSLLTSREYFFFFCYNLILFYFGWISLSYITHTRRREVIAKKHGKQHISSFAGWLVDFLSFLQIPQKHLFRKKNNNTINASAQAILLSVFSLLSFGSRRYCYYSPRKTFLLFLYCTEQLQSVIVTFLLHIIRSPLASPEQYCSSVLVFCFLLANRF